MYLKGNAISPGIAIGEIYIYQSFEPKIVEKYIDQSDVQENLKKYELTKEIVASELNDLIQMMAVEDADKAAIFEAHKEILFDEVLQEEIRELIETSFYGVSWAIDTVFTQYIKILSKREDELIRERVADLRDVCNRLLRNLAGVKEKNLADLQKPVIIVTRDLLPSDTAKLNRHNVLGILTEIGGTTSHSAIIARNYDIPAISGLADITNILTNGEKIIVDALEGIVISEADDEVFEKYQKKHKQYSEKMAVVKKYLNKQALTQDGIRISTNLNIASDNDEELNFCEHSDGVGLFRTEFLYMQRDYLPSEDEQFKIYRRVLEKFKDKPVTLRTLDIGGDKQLKCMDLPHEDNPFLGNRAIRLCFSHPDIFKTQLKAALRAAYYGNLQIMFPMISSMDDIKKAKASLEEARQELERENIPYGKKYKFGIMIEIPSIALMADEVVKEVDFASIGTNDLCQYLLAVDRLNPAVSSYYQSYHPALFRLISFVVEQFNKAGKEISVCGEMGGDYKAVCVLMGMGMRKISMNSSSLAFIKRMITSLTIDEAQKIFSDVTRFNTAEGIEIYLNKKLGTLYVFGKMKM